MDYHLIIDTIGNWHTFYSILKFFFNKFPRNNVLTFHRCMQISNDLRSKDMIPPRRLFLARKKKQKCCASLLPSFWFTIFLLPAKVRNLVFIIWSLLVGIDSVTDKLKTTFSWMKNTLFCPFESPEGWKSHFRPGRTHPDACSPSRKWGLMAPCWYSRLLYSNLLVTEMEAPYKQYSQIKKLI